MAEQKESLKVLIELDDGSIKEGFLRVKKSAEETGKAVGDGLSKGTEGASTGIAGLSQNIVGIATKFGPTLLALGAVKIAAEKAFDFVLFGESLRAAEAQFQSLAQTAGISGDQLRQSLELAGNGLVDGSDAIEIANQGIVKLGENAARLPEVLELARRASAALGGSITERFEAITNAIENGNARALRNQGIVVDSSAAFKAYADSIGVATSSLTLSQRQTALLNEALAVGKDRFAGVNTEVTPLANSFLRLKNASNDLFESLAQSSASSGFSDAIKVTVDGFSDLFRSITGAQAPVTELAKTQSFLATELTKSINKVNELKNAYDALSESEKTGFFSEGSDLKSQIEFRNTQVEDFQKRLIEVNKLIAAQQPVQAEVAAPIAAVDPRTPEQIAEISRLRSEAAIKEQQQALDVANFVQTKRLETLAVERQVLEQGNQDGLAQDALDAQKRLEELAALEGFEIQKQQIEIQFSEANGFSQEQRDAALLAAQQAFNAKSLNQTKALVDGTDALFKKIKEAAFQSLKVGVGQAFASFGAALANGQDAAAAFANSLIGTLGDIAVQMGTSYILQGIAISANPFSLGAGAGLIVAGAALATLGGFLKAKSGGGGGSSSVSAPGSPGGVPIQVQPVDPATGFPDASPSGPAERDRSATAAISVNIQGDVLDSEESGLRIVDILNKAFDKSGVEVRKGAFA